MAFSLRSGGRLGTIVRVIRLARAFQRAEVTGDLTEETALSVDNIVVCTIGVIQNGELLPVAMIDLVQKQITVFHVRLCGNVVLDDCSIRDRNHVVEAEKAEATAVKFQNVLACLQIGMVWLWGFHRDKITEASDGQNNTNIRATLALIEWDTEVTGMEEGNIALVDVTDKKILQNSTFPGKKKRDCGSLAFSCP